MLPLAASILAAFIAYYFSLALIYRRGNVTDWQHFGLFLIIACMYLSELLFIYILFWN